MFFSVPRAPSSPPSDPDWNLHCRSSGSQALEPQPWLSWSAACGWRILGLPRLHACEDRPLRVQLMLSVCTHSHSRRCVQGPCSRAGHIRGVSVAGGRTLFTVGGEARYNLPRSMVSMRAEWAEGWGEARGEAP